MEGTITTAISNLSEKSHLTQDVAALTTRTEQPRSFIAKVLGFVPFILLKIASFATITIPVFFYRILTWSFTLHLNFSSLLVIVAVILMIAYIIVRYRFLTKYSRLKPINKPPKVASSFDLHPDTGDEDYADYSKPGGYKNYPDEFLSAFLSSIKIFGYLEQPVFHELARHLQTKKLLAGDTLFRNPEQERSFYIVVDGHVQMFVKPDNTDSEDNNDDDIWQQDTSSDDDDNFINSTRRKHDKFKNYTLINEVGAGGTLSSLFTILSIFRESFHRSNAREKQRHRSTSSIGRSHLARTTNFNNANEWRQVFPSLDDPTLLPPAMVSRPNSDSSMHRFRKTSKTTQTNGSDIEENGIVGDHEILDGTIPLRKYSDLQHPTQFSRSQLYTPSLRSVHPNIIARATVDTTLAVIPEEAFHKLTQKFPKAAAHIIQVIVTRFQRVTLMTSHRYLGLTNELLNIEKQVIESTSLPQLPQNFFISGGMDRLRRKFNDEETSSQDGDVSLGPSEINRNDNKGIIQAIGIIDIPGTPSLHVKSPVSGDLGQSPTSTKGGSPSLMHQTLNRRGEYSVEDDEHLRTSVMRCISDALGIKIKDLPSGAGDNSPRHTASPRLPRRNVYYPMDLFSHTGTVDASTSPSLEALDSEYYNDDDLDARSTTSSVQSGSDIFGNKSHDSISPDDIQILYFPKDAVLVKEGSHNNGLFFVIDGFLEVSMTPSMGDDGFTDVGKSTKAKKKPLNRQKSRIIDTGFKLSPNNSQQQPESNKTTSAKQDTVVASEVPAGRNPENLKNEANQKKVKKPLFVIKPGNLAGYLGALTGFPSFVEIKAKTDTYVGYVSKKQLEKIIDKNPAVMLKLAHQLVGHVSPLSKSIL